MVAPVLEAERVYLRWLHPQYPYSCRIPSLDFSPFEELDFPYGHYASKAAEAVHVEVLCPLVPDWFLWACLSPPPRHCDAPPERRSSNSISHLRTALHSGCIIE